MNEEYEGPSDNPAEWSALEWMQITTYTHSDVMENVDRYKNGDAKAKDRVREILNGIWRDMTKMKDYFIGELENEGKRYGYEVSQMNGDAERLTAERDAAIAKLNHESYLSDKQISERDKAEAENAQLRQALEEIRRILLAPETKPDMPYSLIANVDHIAAVALGEKSWSDENE